MAVKLKKHGSNIHIADAKSSKVVEFGLYGKATQDGEPTPDNPIEIEISGASGSVEVVSCGKNLYDNINNFTPYKRTGVSISKGTEDTFDVIGTTSGSINAIQKPFSLPKGKYILSTKKYDSDLKIHLYNQTKKEFMAKVINAKQKEVEIVDETDVLDFRFQADSGVTLNVTGQAIMIRLASDTDSTYEPYKETTSTIPTPNGLCGIKVSSGGNYTDENGQQWLTDEIVKCADGSGKRIERIKHYSFAVADMNNLEDFPGWENVEGLREVLGDYLARVTNSMLNIGGMCSANTSANILYLKKGDYGLTQSEWKTRYPDLIVDIYLARTTPIITDLSAEEIAEIEKLHTFYPVTNISNDSDCGMAVTYVSTLIDFIQPKTDWTSSTRFNIEDYNRIKNNITYLHEIASVRVGAIEIEDMGADLVVDADEDKEWDVTVFNAFENNLHLISGKIISADIGTKKTFYENGLFPDFAELNRIENVTLRNKNALDNLSAGLRRIPFRLGQFKTRL